MVFGFKKKPAPTLLSVADGDVIAMDAVSDPVFASKTMGDGFAVRPTSDGVVSPFNGEIVSIFPTKHAIIMHSDDGLDVLIHMGIDTVALKGEGFDIKVTKGDKVSAGQPLAAMDLGYVVEQGKETTIIVVITNLDGKRLKLTTGNASAGTPVLEVK
ncbi:MAG: PTS glucose transporter subunit IIA [Micropruina sp.]|uniref:PTS sugar transporter subunit IIA n=1 Tax=Micropruina sp. TaxID=2737536 RepID=UPI0039E6273D